MDKFFLIVAVRNTYRLWVSWNKLACYEDNLADFVYFPIIYAWLVPEETLKRCSYVSYNNKNKAL